MGWTKLHKVVVTGMGCVSGLGADVASNWVAARDGRCAIRPVTVAVRGQAALSIDTVAAPAVENALAALEARHGGKVVNAADRFANFAAAATLEALADAGLTGSPVLATAHLVYGNASGGNRAIEAGFQRLFDAKLAHVNPRTVAQIMPSAAASHLSMLFGIKGLSFAIASACASSAHAIGEAMHMIRAGRCAVAVVGGSDASLTFALLRSWHDLTAISANGCRPFSAGRAGTNLGEGGATLILEDEEHARARGARIHAEILGAGSTSDANHVTQPDQASAAAAIRAAHADARIDVEEPVLISAHGTGTLLNDRCEAAALHAVYGAHLRNSTVIATKSAHGHLQGASGALELILGIKALQARVAPPVLGYLGPDPDCALPLALEARPIAVSTLVSPSFAFGGLNSVIVARLPQ